MERAFDRLKPLVTPAGIDKILERMGFWTRLLRLDADKIKFLWKLLLGLLGLLLAAFGLEKSGLGKLILDFLKNLW